MLRNSISALALALGVSMAIATPSRAAMLVGGADPAASPTLAQPVQFDLPFPFPLGLFVFGGHDWCWYDDGWRGAGWYWCGYGYNDGYGWGGGEGYHGWAEHRYERDWRGRHSERREEPDDGERYAPQRGDGFDRGERRESHGGEHREFHGGGGEHREFHGGGGGGGGGVQRQGGGGEHHEVHGGGGGGQRQVGSGVQQHGGGGQQNSGGGFNGRPNQGSGVVDEHHHQ